MKRMIAFTQYCLVSVPSTFDTDSGQHTQRTLIAWKLALGASTIVWIATDTTDIVVGHIPPPRRHRVPLFDVDFHLVASRASYPMLMR
jgi:hypothetical protein